ncbi:GMC family oxidoreductase N-terminal domain-containing protein, partial [Bradyrhizobium sp.]|uniref:GMC family oxidoreductase N-terminal domain-containing protein n=1 Tax=Bradyrhizobium sp. TaxID=376 RepID=UPI00391A86E5
SVIEDDLTYGDRDGHGQGGPLPVYRAPADQWGPIDGGLRDAALASGYPWCDDLNGPDGEGVACYPINSRNGRRISTNEAYLEPARGRANHPGLRACHVARGLDPRCARRRRSNSARSAQARMD